LSRAQVARFLASFHGADCRAEAARMLSSWRAFYAFAVERDRALPDNPCAGLKPPKSTRRLPSR
jgi:integrase/recombinase XerC